MKRLVSFIALSMVMLMCITSCGKKGMNGKWDCESADLRTFGTTAESQYYDLVGSYGLVSNLCRMNISDDKLVYLYDNIELKVSNVKRTDNKITFDANYTYGTVRVTVKYDEKNDKLKVKAGDNSYVLVRDGFFRDIFGAIPIWTYILLILAAVLFAATKIFSGIQGKNKKDNGRPPLYQPPTSQNTPPPQNN